MVQLPAGSAFLDAQRILSSLGSLQGKQVADLGCGTGYVTMALAQMVGKEGIVSAVDVMQEPLQSVQAQAESMGLRNVHTIRADLEVLGGTKIPDNSQDVAVLATTLFQSQKKDAMLAEAVRMLKPGGVLLIVEWKKGAQGFGPPDHLRTDEQTMQALATAAGVRFERTVDAGMFYYGILFIK